MRGQKRSACLFGQKMRVFEGLRNNWNLGTSVVMISRASETSSIRPMIFPSSAYHRFVNRSHSPEMRRVSGWRASKKRSMLAGSPCCDLSRLCSVVGGHDGKTTGEGLVHTLYTNIVRAMVLEWEAGRGPVGVRIY